MYDLIVIGAGPGGYEAAAHAGRLGMKTLLAEKEFIGGTCLNVGCIPTKTFLKSARLFSECRSAAAYGVEIAGAKWNQAAVVQRKNKVVSTLTRGVEALLKKNRVEVVRAAARLQSAGLVQVGDRRLEARNILIATGARPAVPPIPGIDSPSVLDSTAVLNLTEVPARVAVIGGGYIGLELAGFFFAAGAAVTVLEMLPRIASGSDADISSRLQQAFKKSGVTLKTSCKVTRIEGNRISCLDDQGAAFETEAECIVNATGRVPVVQDLGLEELGIDLDRKGIKVDERGRTSLPGVWACGDVTGRRQLAHAATREGLVAVNEMAGRRDRIRYEAIPSVIYTHPEVACVGWTEEELKSQGKEYKKALVPMAVAGRFLVENEGGSGVVKVLAGARYGEILGVHMLGDLSSEFIVAAAQMMEMEMRIADVEKVVFPHPTVSEALKLALLEIA